MARTAASDHRINAYPGRGLLTNRRKPKQNPRAVQ